MDEYCIRILTIARDYQNGNGIGFSVLDRKFYWIYEYGEVSLVDKINWLQKEGYLKNERPYSILAKGEVFLNEFERDDIV